MHLSQAGWGPAGLLSGGWGGGVGCVELDHAGLSQAGNRVQQPRVEENPHSRVGSAK